VVDVLDAESDLYQGTLDCVHCGLCLSACPTYLDTGRETSSPRGRVYLMRGVAEGELELGKGIADELHLCLGCRACESACPSGVRYGSLLEHAREALVESGLRAGTGPRLERFLLRSLLARPARLHAFLSAMRLVQGLRLDRLAAAMLPRALVDGLSLLPPIPAAKLRLPLSAHTPALGESRGRVALLEGCVMRELFGSVGRATVSVLARNGFEVEVPRGQVCCGALNAHAGDLAFARELAECNVVAFTQDSQAVASPFDAVVTNSAGCGAAMKEAGDWLPDRGEALASMTYDVCEWLDEQGLTAAPGRLDVRVCYDDPCHLIHGQGIADAPRRLLAAIPGLSLVPHENAAGCCGAAGTWSLSHREMSARILDAKIDAIARSEPDVVCTGNPGCLLQLRAGVEARGLSIRVAHPIELLDEAYGAVAASSDQR
jgi:glycolate oxidase iron-sulfur subunit